DLGWAWQDERGNVPHPYHKFPKDEEKHNSDHRNHTIPVLRPLELRPHCRPHRLFQSIRFARSRRQIADASQLVSCIRHKCDLFADRRAASESYRTKRRPGTIGPPSSSSTTSERGEQRDVQSSHL